MYLYFFLVIYLNDIFFCKYYINIILQELFVCCNELKLNKADRTEVRRVSLFSWNCNIVLLMDPCLWWA
jgi:hypothetical protein